ncbi:MAG: ribonuclease J, partial [Candidatus Aenigmatarchaeota archaeon]
GSALMRIANQEHKYFKIIKGDTLIFSSSIVPGNERIVQNLKDTLTKQGAKIFHYQMMDIHASGHAFADDIRLFINLVKPKYIIPIHGYYYMLKAVQEICNDLNMPAGSVIILSNGDILEVQDGIPKITNEKVPSNLIYVDGLGLGNVGDVVLRDRKVLAEEGMFVIIVIIDSQTGKLKKSPDIISRGFVYLRESQALLKGVRNLIAQIVKKNVVFLGDEAPIIQEDQIKYRIKEDVAEYLFKKTYRRPVILPVVLKV